MVHHIGYETGSMNPFNLWAKGNVPKMDRLSSINLESCIVQTGQT